MEDNCGLSPTQTVADIGSGTGLLTELFLKGELYTYQMSLTSVRDSFMPVILRAQRARRISSFFGFQMLRRCAAQHDIAKGFYPSMMSLTRTHVSLECDFTGV